MKTICIILYDLSVMGGIERATVSLANALAEYYRVFLVSLVTRGNAIPYDIDERIEVFTALEKEDRLRYMRRALKPVLRGYFRKKGIDTAIVSCLYAGYLVTSTCTGQGTRVIFVDHEAMMAQWGRRDLTFMRWLASVKSDRVVTLTGETADAYVRKFRTRRRKIRCIFNWIESGAHASGQYDVNARRIVSAGRLSREKGFDLLIKAMIPVVKRHPDWHVDIFGDGELKDELERLIDKAGVSGNIHLMGMVKSMDGLYAGYALYVLPSYREGMPLVLLEARANRLPIVSFDIMTGPREIVDDGVNGILIEPYDTEKMAEAVNTLIEDEGLRLRMSEHSQDDIERFSKERILGQWKELIESR